MRKFIKRTLVYNRWLSLLYIVAFAATAFLSVLSIKMYGMNQIWASNYRAATYRYSVHCFGSSNTFITQEELPDTSTGIFFASLMLNVGHDKMSPVSGCLILDIHEDFQEELSWGSYPVEDEYSTNPCVVIGPGLKDQMYQSDGEYYIDLFGEIPCRVTGIFKPITFDRNDDRFYLFWSQIPDDIYKELFTGGSHNYYAIYSMIPVSEEELRPLYQLMLEKVPTEMADTIDFGDFDFEGYTNTTYKFDQPDADYMATLLYVIMCIFAIINMLLLSYFWTLCQNKKWCIQFLCGMNAVQIVEESLLTYFFYEVLGFGLIYGIYFLILLFQNGLSEFAQMLYACRGLLFALFLITPLVVGILPFVKLLGMQKSLAVHLKENR